MSGRLNGITDAQLELIYSELSRLNLQIHITRSLYWRVIAASARLDNNAFIVSGWRPNLRNTHNIFLVHTLWSVLFYNPRFHVRLITICALHVQIRCCYRWLCAVLSIWMPYTGSSSACDTVSAPHVKRTRLCLQWRQIEFSVKMLKWTHNTILRCKDSQTFCQSNSFEQKYFL